MPLSPDSIYHTTFEEISYEITSTAENSTLDWTTVYPYLQDIGDGRGYTCGLVGFTTADGDLLDVVNAYTVLEPGNQLAPFISALTTLKAAGEGPSAGTQADSLLGSPFKTRWADLNASDPLLRQAQRQIRDSQYWLPAFNQAVSDQVQGLGLAILYDISVNHGPGTDPNSFGGIVATAQGNAAPPSQGGSESAYLSALVDAREAALIRMGDNQTNGRVQAHRSLIASGNLTLTAPFSWTMYGDPFTISTRPALPAEAERPNALEPGAPAGSGGGFDANLFVSPTGNDANSGTSKTQPKQTIAAALAVAAPGQTISVGAGTYTTNVVINTGGSALGGYITLRSESPKAAIISGSSAGNQAAVEINAGYVRVQDFEITGTTASGVRYGVMITADNVQVINNKIHHICQFLTGGTGFQGGGGIDFEGTTHANITLDGNEIFDIGLPGSTQQLVHGMYLSGNCTNVRVINNLIYRCEDFGVQIYPTAGSSGIQIINNTVAATGRGILQANNGTTRNNIVFNTTTTDYDIRGTGNVLSNNVSGGTGTPSGASGVTTGVNPIFKSYATNGTGDFHLQASSPCIDAGTATGAPSTDISGTARPQGVTFDIGAYEYVPASSGGSTGGGTTTAGTAPGSWFDLTPWYLGLPVDSGGNLSGTSAEIDQPALTTYASSFFQLDGTADMVFTAPVVGAVTSGSSATRTELREVEGGGTTHSAWPIASTTRQLTVTAKWDPTSTDTKTMIVGQIHGASGTPPIYLLVDYSGSTPILKLFANGPSVGTLLSGLTTSTECTYRISVGGGNVKIFAAVGDASALPTSPQFTFSASYFSDNSQCYFKFGAYNKSNSAGGGPGAAITICSHYELIQNGVAYSNTPAASSGGGSTGGSGGTGTLDQVQGPDSTRAAYTQGWGAAVAGDEFDYTGDHNTLTSKGWNVYDGPGHSGNGVRAPTAFTVQDGYLRCHGDAAMNTGGMDFEPNSNGGYSANYYRVECRMRANLSGASNGGSEYHPVLILWPDGNIPWPQGGEYDYAETDIGATNPPMQAFMHHPSSNQSDQSGFDYGPAGYNLGDWHNYALEWSHTSGLTGYIDGVKWFNDPNSSNPNKMHQTIQMDSFFSTGTKMQPADMDVAWFRAYSLAGTGSISLERFIGGGPAGGGTGGGTGGTGGGTPPPGGGGTGGGTGGGGTGGGSGGTSSGGTIGGNQGGTGVADGSSGTTIGIESFFLPVTFSERLVTATDLQTLPSNLNTLCRLTTGKTSGATPSTKPILRLSRAASYSITTSQSLITWDTKIVDSDGMWAPGSPTLITIQTAGWYWITLQVSFASGGATQRQCSLLVNGTTDPTNVAARRDEWLGATSLAHIQCQLYDRFQVGDVIRAYVMAGESLSSDSTEGGTWLSACFEAPY